MVPVALMLVFLAISPTLGERQALSSCNFLQRIREIGLESARQELQESIKEEPDLDWRELITNVVDDARQHIQIREAALEALLTHPDPTVLRDLLELGCKWQERVAGLPTVDLPERLLLACLIGGISNHPMLAMLEKEENLETFVRMTTVNAIGPLNSDSSVLRLLARALLASSTKSDIVVDRILARPNENVFDHSIVQWVDTNGAARLRKALTDTPLQQDVFYFGAASALVTMGDASSTPIFRQKYMQTPEQESRLKETLRQFVLACEAVQSEESLLAFLSRPGNELHSDVIIWAVRHGAQMGIDKSKLRRSVDRYAQSRRAWDASRTSRPDTASGLTAVDLWPLKMELIELGILSAADWPDIQKLSMPQPDQSMR